MKLTHDPALGRFRLAARDWLQANVPGDEPDPADLPGLRRYFTRWQRHQFDAGWAGLTWPKAFGGQELAAAELLIWHEEVARAGAPPAGVCFVGLNNVGPAIMICGTDEQKRRYLPPILRGDEVWCQGFSEPDAGSDLASLRTRGEIRGDRVVVNGQKVWTSYAWAAQFQQLLVRTSPDAPRRHGITALICPLDLPGVEIRPIETMAGDLDFCEVFFSDVEVPIDNVLGAVNEGWQVVGTTFAFERGSAFTAEQISLSRMVDQLVERARSRTTPGDLSYRLAQLRADVAALRSMTHLSAARSARTGEPGPEGSYLRLGVAELMQQATQLAMELGGPEALIWTEPQRFRGNWSNDYLWSFSRTISAGTKDIQRNIIGERVLGLPRS
jgi:alkylation response protein AidB-like acyl-CoA dehydrogenase